MTQAVSLNTKISPDVFVRSLADIMSRYGDSKFAFFLGAGCSVTSGIPSASRLVKEWLQRLKHNRTGSDRNFEEWLGQAYPDYRDADAARWYGRIMKDLLGTPALRQKEVERFVERNDPAFGYAVLAQLLTHEMFGRHCNSVLTTNFDDLVADALYLYTNKKPLVVTHEALAGYAKLTSVSPLVVKLHGDAHLDPKSTESETAELADSVKEVLKTFLAEMGLIFLGYGGWDESIAAILEELPSSALPYGIYWVGDEIPESRTGKWLARTRAVWVAHKDFDELMLRFQSEFGLSHPDDKRFQRLMSRYFETFKRLKERIEARPEESPGLADALRRAEDTVRPEWAVILEADRYKKNDPGRADSIYLDGLRRYPGDVDLLESYAIFLIDVRKDYDRAEEFFKRALAADPNDAIVLGNYANLLSDVRKDYDQAEEFFKRALAADPNHANNLGNYANLLSDVRNDYDQAEEYYKRALAADPNHANNLGNYALFLKNVRKDYDQAEEFFKRALAADPNHANNLGNYALFLSDVRKDYDQAEEYYKRALAADPNHANNLGNYALFLKNVRKDSDQAEEYYKRALAADPNDANNLGNYAIFLKNIRKDYERAEEHYRRAIEADPNDVNSLANYGGLLLALGDNAGFAFVQQGIDLAEADSAQALECHFYRYAHSKTDVARTESLSRLEALLKSAVRSPGWDLTQNVHRAIQDGHPDPERLKQLAKKIAEEPPPSPS